MPIVKQFILACWKEWKNLGVTQLAAAVTYYTIFSLPPMLVLTITIAGAFFGRSSAEGRLLGEVTQTIGPQGGEFVQEIIRNTFEQRPNFLASFIGAVMFLYSASGAFRALRSALNIIFEAKTSSNSGILSFLEGKLLALGMAVFLGALLMLSILTSAIISSLSRVTGALIPSDWINIQMVHEFAGIIIASMAFATTYRFLSDNDPSWQDALFGGGIASILFTIGKILLGLYLSEYRIPSFYGTAGDVTLLLLWIYYSIQIFFLGAICTKVRRDLKINLSNLMPSD